ncbi:alpha/beta fold hydrolase [Actinoplanes friuliensis]|uniref:Alpha/beta hydrolase fold protein n=1 Tax=Actinoplanes friuliensis DSM 7358 TaxID=1246995 RepID=U5W3T2_9ACTN|nr:alpha/beta hydrolase [Actinoplanes friuliensis]AGZ42566.1 alpha/beta hydrolase fold protein [Actinoplanes friuliensis DSM 7358]
MTIAHVNGVDLHYQDFGTGDPVVLIHGWPLSSRSWEAQIPALIADGRRVVTYDRRGFGQSEQTWDGYDYDTFAADLDGLLQHLDLRNVTLVGFSMGGGEVARYLGTYGSDRIAKAVFAGAVPPYLYKTDDNPEGALDDATIKAFQQGVTSDRIAFVDVFATNFFTAGKDLKVSDAQVTYAQELAHVASPKGTLDCISAFGLTDFRGDLAKIDVPTLVIHGDSDAIVPLENSGKRTHEAIAGSTLVVIPDGPHGINASHPAEFNEALLAFLNS